MFRKFIGASCVVSKSGRENRDDGAGLLVTEAYPVHLHYIYMTPNFAEIT